MDSGQRYSTIPHKLKNPKDGCTYKRLRLLGKGAFAVCFQYMNIETYTIVAVKVIAKYQSDKKDKLNIYKQEILIHSKLNHKNIVKFLGFFEDTKNIYVFLELCENYSMMELCTRRKTLTLFECRFYVQQLASAILYLHNMNIIHRDLKLGNIFIDGSMSPKLGDFGLAAILDSSNTKKKTFCGTPNYLAPEILSKSGHGFEVDAWALGCIIYTFLVGKPPFETESLKVTYSKIKKNEFTVPLLDADARDLIVGLLQPNPERRYTLEQVVNHKFLTGYIPDVLPRSCLTTRPRIEDNAVKKPLYSNNILSPSSALLRYQKDNPQSSKLNRSIDVGNSLLLHLYELISNCVSTCAKMTYLVNDELIENPTVCPLYFITRWKDGSLMERSGTKGLCYELSDGSCGILFRDSTRLLLHPDDETYQYIQKDGTEMYFLQSHMPNALTIKLNFFKSSVEYMKDCLIKTSLNVTSKDLSGLRRLPYIVKWMVSNNVVLFLMSNGQVQANFLDDHFKFVLCPTLQSVTCVHKGETTTMHIPLIMRFGMTKDVFIHLDLIRLMLKIFVDL